MTTMQILSELKAAKSNMRSEIIRKGVSVPENTPLTGFSERISLIEVGSSGEGLRGFEKLEFSFYSPHMLMADDLIDMINVIPSRVIAENISIPGK